MFLQHPRGISEQEAMAECFGSVTLNYLNVCCPQ